MLDKLVNGSLEPYRLRIPILSPASGILAKECSFEELLRQAIHNTLCEQVWWDKILLACVDLISQDEIYQGCTILPCASNAATLLSSALSSIKSKNLSISNALNTSVENIQSAMPTGRFEHSKIAIIGFSGRFQMQLPTTSFGNYCDPAKTHIAPSRKIVSIGRRILIVLEPQKTLAKSNTVVLSMNQ